MPPRTPHNPSAFRGGISNSSDSGSSSGDEGPEERSISWKTFQPESMQPSFFLNQTDFDFTEAEEGRSDGGNSQFEGNFAPVPIDPEHDTNYELVDVKDHIHKQRCDAINTCKVCRTMKYLRQEDIDRINKITEMGNTSHDDMAYVAMRVAHYYTYIAAKPYQEMDVPHDDRFWTETEVMNHIIEHVQTPLSRIRSIVDVLYGYYELQQKSLTYVHKKDRSKIAFIEKKDKMMKSTLDKLMQFMKLGESFRIGAVNARGGAGRTRISKQHKGRSRT